MEEQIKSHEESLHTIKQMLEQSRNNLQDSSPFYLLWGWLVLAAGVVEYLMLTVWPSDYHFMVWPPAILIGIIGSLVIGKKQSQKQQVKTFIDNAMMYVWSGFLAMLFIILLSAAFIGWPMAYVLIIGMYGMGSFISGGILKFRPLIWGGVLSWAIALIGLFGGFATSYFPNALLLLIASIILSYLVPGYLLKSKQQ